jgi:hypothetical protein
MKPARLFLFTMLLSGTATVVHAQATINFTESIDFSGNPTLPTVIAPTLGNGTNSINGTIGLIPAFTPSGGVVTTDEDAFQINNPSLLPILGINIEIKNFVGVGGQSGSLELLSGVFTFANAIGNSGIVTFDSNGLFTLPATVTDASSLLFYLIPPQSGLLSGTYDYTLNIVAGVPEPSTTALLVGATLLAGMVGFVRRRKNSTRA